MFDWTDQQITDAITWAMLLCFLIMLVAAGSLVYSLHREYRRFLKEREVRTRWKGIVEGGGK